MSGLGDGLNQAALIASGEVTPSDLLEAAILRAEAVNPAINAITVPLYDQARAAAAQREAVRPWAERRPPLCA